MQQKSREDPISFKVLILGDSGVGKTSISQWFKKYNDDDDDDEKTKEEGGESHSSLSSPSSLSSSETGGVGRGSRRGIIPPKATTAPDIINLMYILKKDHLIEEEHKNDVIPRIRLQVWDTVGHEIHDIEKDTAHTTITKLLLRDADVIIFCFDINDDNDKSVVNVLEKWRNLIYRSPIQRRWRKTTENETYEDVIKTEIMEEEEDESKVQQANVKPHCLFYLVGNKIDLSDGIQSSLNFQPVKLQKHDDDDDDDEKSKFCLTLKINEDDDHPTNHRNRSSSVKKIIPIKMNFKKTKNVYYDNASKLLHFNYETQNIPSTSSHHSLINRKNNQNSPQSSKRVRPQRSISVSYGNYYSSSNHHNLDQMTTVPLKQPDYSIIRNIGKKLLLAGHDYNEIFLISSNVDKSFGIEHLFEFICIDLINCYSYHQSNNNNAIQKTTLNIITKLNNKSSKNNKSDCCF